MSASIMWHEGEVTLSDDFGEVRSRATLEDQVWVVYDATGVHLAGVRGDVPPAVRKRLVEGLLVAVADWVPDQ